MNADIWRDELLRQMRGRNPLRDFQDQRAAAMFRARPVPKETSEMEKLIRGFLAMCGGEGWRLRVVQTQNPADLDRHVCFQWLAPDGERVDVRLNWLLIEERAQMVCRGFVELARRRGWRAWARGLEQVMKEAA
jgi:hypothetical protein